MGQTPLTGLGTRNIGIAYLKFFGFLSRVLRPYKTVQPCNQYPEAGATEHGQSPSWAQGSDPVSKGTLVPLATIMFVSMFLVKWRFYVTNFEKNFQLFKRFVVVIRKVTDVKKLNLASLDYLKQ